MVSDDVTNKTELLREKWFRAMGHEASMVAPRFNFDLIVHTSAFAEASTFVRAIFC